MKNSNGPDLSNGYAIVGNKDAKNLWRTEIRSVLHRKSSDEKAYLTHECRGEAISGDIIFRGANYEYAAIKGWLDNFSIRSGAFRHGFGYTSSPAYYQKGIDIDVECPEVQIKEYSLVEALQRTRESKLGRLFVKVDYEFNGESWEVYSPACYINYPNQNGNADEYLQPISGYTLFYNGERFVISYVACYMENDKTHIEFIAREPANFFDLKLGVRRIATILGWFKPITNTFLRTDDFHKVYTVEGNCTVYEYE